MTALARSLDIGPAKLGALGLEVGNFENLFKKADTAC
jgi:hypothetical protein